MNIQIIAVGKLKEKYLTLGMNEYLKRLTSYTKLQIVEVDSEKVPEKLSNSEKQLAKSKEGKRILTKINYNSHLIVLTIEGTKKSSERFARDLKNLSTYGQSKVSFVIGGSLGTSQSVIDKADECISFSDMTFPHQLMRLILIEQIYRSFRINFGHTYQK